MKRFISGDERQIHTFTGSETPEYEEDLIDLLDKEFKRRQDERRPFELQWQLNIEFYNGNQQTRINTVSGSLEEQPLAYWWQERECFNQTAPIIDTRLSKLSRMRPILRARPATGDMDDINAAKVSSKLLMAAYNNLEIKDKQDSANTWCEMAGTVFWKHAWDAAKGEVIGEIEGEQIQEGDIDQYEVPPFEIFPDSCWVEDLNEQRSLIHAKPFHVRDIKDLWGVAVDPEPVEVLELERTRFGEGSLAFGSGSYTSKSRNKENYALVKEYWEKPTLQYPKGRLIIVANKKLLYAGDMPYRIGEDEKEDYPFVKQVCLKRPGCFWGTTVLQRLIPIQRRYNRIKNATAEYINRVTIGQIAVEIGSVDLDDLEQDAASPGKIVEYAQGTRPPEYMRFPELPGSLKEEEIKCLDDFSRISGVSEISRNSEAPSGVKSGIALSIALEQDDTRLSRTVENIVDATVKNGIIELRLYKQYAKFERVTRYVDNQDEVQVLHWTGNDLKSEDIIIENSSALAESPAQKRQMVFDLLESGLYNDPDTGRLTRAGRNKVFDLLEMGNWESYDDMEQLQMNKAERENQILMKGQFTGINDYDDDTLHIMRHNRFRLTTDYEDLISGQDGQYFEQLFSAHIEQHVIRMQMLAQQQMQLQQPAPEGQPA